MKRLTVLVISLVLLTSFASGLWANGGKETGSESDTVTLTLFHHMSEEAKRLGIEALAAGFTAENPNVSFDIQAMDFGQYASTLKTKIAADDAPDIFFGRPKSYTDMVKAGHVLEITGADYLDAMQDSALPALTIDGSVYGILLDVTAMGTYYNKDLFAQAGIEVPTSADELIAACEALEAAGIDAFSRGFKDGWTAQVAFNALYQGGMFSAHPDFMQEITDGEKKWADYPEFVESLETWAAVLPYGNDDMFGTDYSKSIELFATGQAAMFSQGLWALGEIRKISPDINIGFMIPPGTNNPDDLRLSAFGDDGFMASAAGKNVDLAEEFLAFCLSPKGAAIWSDVAGQVSFLKESGYDYTDPVQKDFLDYVSQGQTVGQEDGPFLSGQMDATFREYQELFPAQDDPSDVAGFLADLDAEFDAIR